MRSQRARAALLAVTAALVSSCGGASDAPPGPPRAAAPTFSPEAPLNFRGSVEVALGTSTAGATIRYTTDGTDPTASSSTYVGPLTLTTTTVVKALATAPDHAPSGVAAAGYTYRPVDLVLESGVNNGYILFYTAPTAPVSGLFNRFTPAPEDFPFQLRTVRFQLAPGTVLPLTLAVYADPDGVPTHASLVDAFTVTSSAPTGWTEVDLVRPVRLNGPGDVFLGLVSANNVGCRWSNTSQGRLYTANWTPEQQSTAPALSTATFHVDGNSFVLLFRGSN